MQPQEHSKTLASKIVDRLRGLRGVARQQEKKTVAKYQFVLSDAKGLIVLPDEKDLRKVSVTYELVPPYARAQIRWSETDHSLIYRVSEPTLDENEKRAYELIVAALVELVDVQLSTIKNARAAMEYIEQRVWQIIIELEIALDKASYNKIMYYVYRNFVGLNKLEPLMHDPYIEDVGCVGYYTPIYVVHKRWGSIPTNIIYENEDELKEFVIKLAERCGRYVSYAEPLLDGSLPDGSRVQASLAEDVTTKGPTFSIRKFTEEPISPVELLDLKTASADVMAYLWLAMEQGVSLLICGGTATGKTTLLNAISMFIPPEEKVVSIEDTRELQLPHKNWIPAVARTGFGAPEAGGERYGEVDMFDLLKESFRQNPDYVIVGEIRGKEAYVMFQGMASGHPSIGTMHAAGVETVIKRLMSPPIELSPSLVEILDLVITMVFAQEKGKSSRRIKTVSEIQSVEPTGSARTGTVYRWVPSTDTFEEGEGSYVLSKLATTKGYQLSDMKKELAARTGVLRWMLDNRITHWKEVAALIGRYHQNPNGTLKELGLAAKGLRSVMVRKAPSEEHKEYVEPQEAPTGPMTENEDVLPEEPRALEEPAPETPERTFEIPAVIRPTFGEKKVEPAKRKPMKATKPKKRAAEKKAVPKKIKKK
ncbi:MAG: Flp pilus assembly complex ATPase component TadA [Candidatus Aenigmarchaeota archaeon]|nr:Flp pilus assembly complex ATPase component TadA [Candidatus Aenigmarchaeota archaeon]